MQEKKLLFHRLIFKRIIIYGIFIILFFTSLLIGVKNISIFSLLNFERDSWHLVFNSRGPRTLAIILTASSLTVGGFIMQIVSRNKFVSPSTIGTTNAAQLAMIVMFVFIDLQSLLIKLIISFTFAFISSLIFMAILKRIKFNNIIYVPLLGIMYGAVIQAITYFIAYNTNLLQTLEGFSVANFSTMIAGRFEPLLILIIPLSLAVIYSSVFNIVGMGEDFAKNLGVNYHLFLTLGLLISSLISAVTFVVIGPIAFMGLIIPNIVTMIYGDNIKKSIFDMMIFGSSFLLAADIIARTIISPYEFPVSIIVGIVGSITFLILIFKRSKQ